ncbi:hypothetical protein Halru_1812 [Halovivax ruber XH-70]|uniref:Uncharacterized protein n=1 Tax=Halovivax ruber (strain DSM 18193 / JCM 13892 / XH-70) TaxID=797302 RepID=L0IDX4_HALRX|nr:hypothetical protein [Halovivax ruber]AGB16411.1 hypothetical protein Halru_1812 [Halovivax ruber XH-70]
MSGSETGDGVDESNESGGAQATYTEPESGGQAGRQHPGGFDRSQPGTDLGDLLSDHETQRFLKGLLGTFAVLSVAIFLMFLLVDAFGDPALTVEEDLTSQEQGQVHDFWVFSIVQNALGFLPYLGLLVVGGFGLLVGTHLSKPDGEKFKVSAIGAFAGLALFVFVTTFLGSTQIPEISSGSPSGIVIGTSLETTQLLINSLVFGVVGAIVSAGVTYVSVTFAK